MKSIFLALVLPLSFIACAHNTPVADHPAESTDRSVAAAPQLLLDYESGFQAAWSTFQLYSDGSIQHTERICCPPKTAAVKEARLPETEVRDIVALINEASKGTATKKVNQKLELGEKIGSFYGFNAAGQKLMLKVTTRVTTDRGTIEINHSPAVEKLLTVVRRYVKNSFIQK